MPKAQEASLFCLGSADAREVLEVVVSCLPQPFYYLSKQIPVWHLGAEENLLLEGAQVWDLQHLCFWILLVYPLPQPLLSS